MITTSTIRSCGSSSRPESPRTVPAPAQVQPAPLHRLADVKLKGWTPYSKEKIDDYLEKHQVRRTGTFDDCLFQSVLFTEFFEKIEAGEIEPGQPGEHEQTPEYLLKKSVELLQPLGAKIDEAQQRYNQMLETSRKTPILHTNLEKEREFVDGMVARFQTLEKNLLAALAEPRTFEPTRDKACFLLFAHAILVDAANAMQRWMTDLAAGEHGANITLSSFEGDQEMILRYVKWHSEERSNLFSAEPLTPADKKLLYEKAMTFYGKYYDGVSKTLVPSFSPTGSQGVLAILHCVFHGNSLLTGAIDQPYAVHSNAYEGSHLATLRHDCSHAKDMFSAQVLSSVTRMLMPIYLKLENPASNLPADAVIKDLLLLFHVLHENTEFHRADPNKSFVQCVEGHIQKEFYVADAVALLGKVGVSIPGIEKNSSPGEMVKHYKAIAQAMNDLWKGFRQRHAEDLKASGLFDMLPKLLED